MAAESRGRQVLYLAWAAIVGASVTLQLCATVVLNGRSHQQSFHALFVSNISVMVGGLFMLPQSLLSAAAWSRPKRQWSMTGGAWAVLSFVCIPAGKMLGIQVVLLFQLLAMLTTALLFDFRRGEVKLTDFTRLGGFGVVLLGVLTDNLAASSAGTHFTPLAMLCLAGTFLSGVGFALQAKCNSRLARDLGGTSRAVLFSAAVNVLVASPVDVWIRYGKDVHLVFQWSDWPLWLFGGCQSAFYIGSLAHLPKKLGYTAAYLTLLLGKLASSSAVDALGLAGRTVPFDWPRALALALVLAGTALFSGVQLPGRACCGEARTLEEGSCMQAAESVASFHPSFCAPEEDTPEDLLGGAVGSGN